MRKRAHLNIDELPRIGGLPSWKPALRAGEKRAGERQSGRGAIKIKSEYMKRFPKDVMDEIGSQLESRGDICSDWNGKFTSDRSIVKPKTYGDCLAAGWGSKGRPCPFVSCSNHLYIDVKSDESGIVYNFPDCEVEDLEETCALRVADGDDVTLSKIGELLSVTRERIRQIELQALAQIRNSGVLDDEKPEGQVFRLRVVRDDDDFNSDDAD